MLRITTQNGADGLVLKLEGCLSGAWVEELDACWRAATKTLEGEGWPTVDLSEVYSVDEAGRQLLAVMYRAGMRFVARGCFMRELVREISESAGVGGRN